MGGFSIWHWIILLIPLIVAIIYIGPLVSAKNQRVRIKKNEVVIGDTFMSNDSTQTASSGNIPTASSKYCVGCGKLLHQSARVCPNCGADQAYFNSKSFGNSKQTSIQFYFNARGRIGRQQWWIGHLILFVPLLILIFLAAILEQPSSSDHSLSNAFLGILFIVWVVTYIWSGICLNAKRWHDNDYSGWMQLIGAIPLLGIWALIENGFLRGTEGSNRFGEDPLA
jgi:uncharacterized membrane protein YhaH (DUF805 family)/predicted RNA-binding Zn-ribbon protein involved in translation (DUF1610 family)